MIDPLGNTNLTPLKPTEAASSGDSQTPAVGDEFAKMLRDQLERVSDIQREASDGVERLMTGQTQNVTEVFTAARKAEVAFTLLMEIRNKLVDAYTELRQIRV